MACHPAHQHDTAMLQATIGVPQACTYAACSGLHGRTHHFIEPFRVGDLDVVVQQQQQLALRLASGKVVDRGIIEWFRIRQHLHTGLPKLI